jgi:glycosyltransferase involved in cell wall biosynthesis
LNSSGFEPLSPSKKGQLTSPHPLRVLLTTTSYPRSLEDWKGVFMRHLVEALAALPETSLRVWAPPGPLPPSAGYACEPAEAAWLDQLAQRGGIAQALRSRSLACVTAPLRLVRLMRRAYRRERADVIHANWLQSALPLFGLPTPAVVTVLGTDFALLKVPGMPAALRRVLRQRRCVIAPNAEWMRPRLEELFGDIAAVRPVPFGVASSWYDVARAYDAAAPRRWLTVLRVTRAKIGPLFEWGAKVFGRDDELHLFGPMQEDVTIPDWVHFHGPTHSAELLRQWVPSAAGMVTLSQHDEGRPQVLLEAMASGLPVVASAIPGHESFIDHGKTGWLVRGADDLAAAVRSLADPARNAALGAGGRAWVRRELGTWTDCARRYAELYRAVLAPAA